MREPRTAVLIVLGVLLTLYSLDCLAPGVTDTQAMECCASMPCSPANHSHDCCKTMVSAAAPYVVSPTTVAAAPALQPVASGPPLAGARIEEQGKQAEALLQVNEHAPPMALYTAHHSLLI